MDPPLLGAKAGTGCSEGFRQLASGGDDGRAPIMPEEGLIHQLAAHSGAGGAIDAQNKLFRLGVPVTAHIDPHMQIMSAASLMAGDVLLSFSYSRRGPGLFPHLRWMKQALAQVRQNPAL